MGYNYNYYYYHSSIPYYPKVGLLEASKGGTKVGRMKDPLHKDSYSGITPPTFILPFEAPEFRTQGSVDSVVEATCALKSPKEDLKPAISARPKPKKYPKP